MQYVDQTVEKQRRQSERAQEMLIQLQSIAESMQAAHDQQTHLLKATVENQIQRLQSRLCNKLLSQSMVFFESISFALCAHCVTSLGFLQSPR